MRFSCPLILARDRITSQQFGWNKYPKWHPELFFCGHAGKEPQVQKMTLRRRLMIVYLLKNAKIQIKTGHARTVKLFLLLPFSE